MTLPYQIKDLFTDRARAGSAANFGAAGQAAVPTISLAYGLADPVLFPREELTAAAAEVLASDAAAALNYGMSYTGLTDLICAKLASQGVTAQPENILVSYGSGQILALLPQVFIEPGDTVIIEGPSFMGAVMRFVSGGANIVTIPVDAHGMDVDLLATRLSELKAQGIRPKFIYTIPTFHNPTGVTMSLERRQRLVALAAEYGVLIIEDDAYGDLRFSGEPLPTLASLDTAGWVMRICTFSKILAPGVRIGWVYAQPEIIEQLAKFKSEGTTGPFITRVVAHYAAEGRLDTHIDELRELYSHKCNVMLEAIEREMPGVTVIKPEGGFFIWATLPAGVSARALLKRSEELGATFLLGSGCYPPEHQGDNEIRLCFSFQNVQKIEEAIGIVGKAMRELQAK